MIPFGPWHPDAAGINTQVCREARNCLPSTIGFEPLPGPVANGGALNGTVFGAAIVIKNDGQAAQFAGTSDKLYRLITGTWTDVTRSVGGAYATAVGERWRFAQWGTVVIATNYNDAPQKYDTATPTTFAALGGSPPKARYIAVVRDQVVLGGFYGNENRIGWSGTNNSEFWTFGGGQNCDYQDFPNGGPIRGLLGGAVGYVFQAYTVTRMTQTPGSTTIYQFDEVQGAKGLSAPNSLVKTGDMAFYLSTDGFYKFNTVSGEQAPIGVGKWRQWFLNDMRTGTELSVLGGADPVNPIILWPYISRDNSSTIPDRVVIYNWALDEATFADISVEALATWVASGYTLDTINSFGTLDTLPYSLDSPFWKSGASSLGVFQTDHKLSQLAGPLMEAQWTTADGQATQRLLVTATRPYIDATRVEVSVVMRERDSDAVNFADADFAPMEDTGLCGAWSSGNIGRARVWVPSGDVWTCMKGLETKATVHGRR